LDHYFVPTIWYGDGTSKSVPEPAPIDVPFISHIELTPATSLRHTRSSRPSALQSPRATILKLRSATARSEPEPGMRDRPFISHRTFSPVVAFRQITSETPSPLRSATAAARHAVPICSDVRPEAGVKAVPFIIQIALTPVVSLRQRMSERPSLLNLPTPPTFQSGGTFGSTPEPG